MEPLYRLFLPNKAAYDLFEMQDFLAQYLDAKVALDQLAFAKPRLATANTVAVRKALEDEVQQVLSGKKRPAEALNAAQENANRLMKPYVDETALKAPKCKRSLPISPTFISGHREN
jgi:sn-glycerol 3-phosphate transport system substrate-binding protein